MVADAVTSCERCGELLADVDIWGENVDAADKVFMFEADCVNTDDSDENDKNDVTLVAVATEDSDTNDDTVIESEYIGEFVMD